MIFNVEQLAAAIGLAVLTERLVAYFVRPLFDTYKVERYPWLMYVGLVVGLVIGLLSNVNAFGDLFAPLVGRILTAVLIGGGSNLIHDVVDGIANSGKPNGGADA